MIYICNFHHIFVFRVPSVISKNHLETRERS